MSSGKSKFVQGQTVYDHAGRVGYFIHGDVASSRAAVEEVYEDPHSGEPIMRLRIWDVCFAEPPRQRTEKSIAELEEREAKLRAEIERLRAERTKAELDAAEITLELDRHAKLKRLLDFIAGRISHFVVLSYPAYRIVPFDEAMKLTDSERSHWDKKPGLKLLTLYGLSNGDLSWRINRYSDGSGSDRADEVVPFTSEADAIEYLRERCAKDLAPRPTSSTYWPFPSYAFEAAKKYGFEIPQHILDEIAKTARSELKRLETEAIAAAARVESQRASAIEACSAAGIPLDEEKPEKKT